MSNEEEINSLVAQIRALQIRQTALIERLLHLSEDSGSSETASTTRTRPAPTAPRQPTRATRPAPTAPTEPTRAGPATRDAPRQFRIGDRVRIRNPGPFQASKGRIERITAERIVVRTSDGREVQRHAKNIQLLE